MLYNIEDFSIRLNRMEHCIMNKIIRELEEYAKAAFTFHGQILPYNDTKQNEGW